MVGQPAFMQWSEITDVVRDDRTPQLRRTPKDHVIVLADEVAMLILNRLNIPPPCAELVRDGRVEHLVQQQDQRRLVFSWRACRLSRRAASSWFCLITRSISSGY